MARRVSLIALLAALAIGGCTYGQPARLTAEQREARITFIENARDFDDHELARVCPGLYPDRFLTDDDEYPEENRDHRDPPAREIAELRAQASAAGCDVPSPE